MPKETKDKDRKKTEDTIENDENKKVLLRDSLYLLWIIIGLQFLVILPKGSRIPGIHPSPTTTNVWIIIIFSAVPRHIKIQFFSRASTTSLWPRALFWAFWSRWHVSRRLYRSRTPLFWVFISPFSIQVKSFSSLTFRFHLPFSPIPIFSSFIGFMSFYLGKFWINL